MKPREAVIHHAQSEALCLRRRPEMNTGRVGSALWRVGKMVFNLHVSSTPDGKSHRKPC